MLPCVVVLRCWGFPFCLCHTRFCFCFLLLMFPILCFVAVAMHFTQSVMHFTHSFSLFVSSFWFLQAHTSFCFMHVWLLVDLFPSVVHLLFTKIDVFCSICHFPSHGFLFHACLLCLTRNVVSFWWSGTLFHFVHVWLFMDFFSCCCLFVVHTHWRFLLCLCEFC